MPGRLVPLSWDALVQRLRGLGFEGPYRGGKHYFMVRGTLRLTIPNPHGSDISVALLKEIINRAGISREKWLK
ncbi:MAG: type II toxin-antitoxin system HicA family toxin [Dehalococcoidia bacterium]|nr:type II toxin-antitoxin system HicA family toxin [Dehalococcoidia bacterium]